MARRYPTPAHDPRPIAAVGVLVLAFAAALLAVTIERPTTTPPCTFEAPILCAELPPDGATLGATLTAATNPPGRWRLALVLDMPFLVGYATLLGLGLRRVAVRRRTHARAAALALTGAVILGAALDAVENVGIMRALDAVMAGAAPSDGLATLTRLAATAKFALLAVGCAGLAVFAWHARIALPVRIAYAVGGLLALPALLGAAVPRLVELSALGVTVSCAVVVADALAGLRRRRVATQCDGMRFKP